MTRIEEGRVTTTTTGHVDPHKQHVDNINLNINTKNGETVTVTEPPGETSQTRTTTTHTEVRQAE